MILQQNSRKIYVNFLNILRFLSLFYQTINDLKILLIFLYKNRHKFCLYNKITKYLLTLL
ncbi:hypothetical protein CHAB381_0613 [Campylobacter hominis ATCC BAA-381]|uniref:Uncharacterized protein n=1 Tax=Campylobacter hominis (strain ATCC BAA-381 / DSM 21671 / CCUG 45161 / LMG 19568 / NCTC 13146 / CH001A) TaxID=360107 RepID=A7I109_CAMHC|nr:hypothetical protein CHAB381_0613 [Campylobacter hominis ATCC BAA-381]